MKILKEKLIEKLEHAPKKFKIVLMPHLCIDNFVHYGESYESFIGKFENIVRQGGGNLSIEHTLHIGGKAANCASALASLGVQTYLIAKTNELGCKLLEHFFEGKDIDLSHVSKDGDLAYTTIMEFEGANVMLSDPGSVSQFGSKYLTDRDERSIKEADIVSISDWGLNEKGTELAKHVFSLVKEEKKGKTFFDPGDPSPKGKSVKEEIRKLVTWVIEKGLVDILSVNEDEVKRYGGIDYLRKKARVDLHTNDYARSFYGDGETEKIPTFDIQPKRLTGAGDAWNAGDMLGEGMGLSGELRLLLANAVAAYYISDSEGRHPGREELKKFLEEESLKKV